MGLKTDTSLVDARSSKMEIAIKNIAALAAVGNLMVDQLIEHEVTTTIIAKATFAEEPKWTTVMVENVHQVVSPAVETLANAPKHEEHKLNLRLMGLEAKEDKTEKELV
jgi:hypothetical protein